MNKVIIMGRLVRDPEVRYTAGENQMAVGKWTLAVNRRFRKEGEKEADFFDCKAFGKTAEHVEKFWRKGMQMLLTGRLEQRQWKDKEGKAKTSVEIVVDDIEFTERKEAATEPTKIDEDLPFTF